MKLSLKIPKYGIPESFVGKKELLFIMI